MDDRMMVDKNGVIRRASDGSKDGGKETCECCKEEKKEASYISFFAHENAMMHKDTDNERAHRTTLFVCISFLLIVVIFVVSYTVRTSIWLETIKELNAEIIRLAGAKGFLTP